MAQAPLKNRMYRAEPMKRVQGRPRQPDAYKPVPMPGPMPGDPVLRQPGVAGQPHTMIGAPRGNFQITGDEMRAAQKGGDRLSAFGEALRAKAGVGADGGMPQVAGYRQLNPGENVDLTGAGNQMARAQASGGFQRVSPGLYRSPDGKIVRQSQMNQMQKSPMAQARGGLQPKPRQQMGIGSALQLSKEDYDRIVGTNPVLGELDNQLSRGVDIPEATARARDSDSEFMPDPFGRNGLRRNQERIQAMSEEERAQLRSRGGLRGDGVVNQKA